MMFTPHHPPPFLQSNSTQKSLRHSYPQFPSVTPPLLYLIHQPNFKKPKSLFLSLPSNRNHLYTINTYIYIYIVLQFGENMTEILQSTSQFPSSPSAIPCVPPPTDNDGLYQQTNLSQDPLFNSPTSYPVAEYRRDTEEREEEREREEGDQLSLLTVVVTVFRKSLVACRSGRVEDFSSSSSSSSMEIGWPTNVRHVAHVTFDRFNGFLGLPVEFEPEVPRRPPSASTRIFGVSTESMQLSFDSRGNSVPMILLMMQRRLYAQGGLKAEGIFRINADNTQEEYVREQLNSGVVPDNIDMHCLAGLIKAWFRELPNGLLDSLPPEDVMQAQSEEECVQLVRRLPPTEAALLDWAINLMTDVAQLESLNKMNARNIAMVFAPNMTQMADPLTALMYAVQVMNFLRTLIVRTLKEREDSMVEQSPPSQVDPPDENGHGSSQQPLLDEVEDEANEEEEQIQSPGRHHIDDDDSKTENEAHGFLTSIENIIPAGGVAQSNDALITNVAEEEDCSSGRNLQNTRTKKTGQSSNSNNNLKKGPKKVNERRPGKSRGTSIVSRLNSRTERVEAWR